MIKISRIYQSVRREGINVGKPATFIELDDNGKEYMEERIFDILNKGIPCRLLVIMGKEPLTQIAELCGKTNSLLNSILKNENLPITEIELETTGLIRPDQNSYWNVTDFSVSPIEFTDETAKKFDEFYNIVGDITTLNIHVNDEEEFNKRLEWVKNKVKSTLIAQEIIFIVKNYNLLKKITPTCRNDGFRVGMNILPEEE